MIVRVERLQEMQICMLTDTSINILKTSSILESIPGMSTLSCLPLYFLHALCVTYILRKSLVRKTRGRNNSSQLGVDLRQSHRPTAEGGWPWVYCSLKTAEGCIPPAPRANAPKLHVGGATVPHIAALGVEDPGNRRWDEIAEVCPESLVKNDLFCKTD